MQSSRWQQIVPKGPVHCLKGKSKIPAKVPVSNPTSLPVGSKSKANKGRNPIKDGWEQTPINWGIKSSAKNDSSVHSTDQSTSKSFDSKESFGPFDSKESFDSNQDQVALLGIGVCG